MRRRIDSRGPYGARNFMIWMSVAPLSETLSGAWRTATMWRRALWLGAIGLCLLHMTGIGAWIALTPSFAPTLTDGPPDLAVYYHAGQALSARAPLYWHERWPSAMAYYCDTLRRLGPCSFLRSPAS